MPSIEAERLTDALEMIADACGVDADVEVTEDGGGLRAEFVGDDLGLLIGHHGTTIDAIQHLAYRIAFKDSDARSRVTVEPRDTGSAGPPCCDVCGPGRGGGDAERGPVALDPMSASERRVVHEHLKGRRDVETYSEGQDRSPPRRGALFSPDADHAAGRDGVSRFS